MLLLVTIASAPSAVAFIRVVPEVVSAPDPINVFRSLVVFKDCPALVPTAVLFPPVVLNPSASCPRARFSFPETFLDKLSTPLRPGTHANTAFSFSLMIEYALIANDTNLYNKIKDYSIKNFSTDTNCPVNYEPSGTDFLSPCLAEAALMSSILEKKEFNEWFKKFIPSLKEPEFNNIINPPVVLDPKDPGIGHLIGLMFHRAWTLKEIANKLNKKSEKTILLQISDLHSKKGYDIMFESGYGGEHWLATFALYNFLR